MTQVRKKVTDYSMNFCTGFYSCETDLGPLADCEPVLLSSDGLVLFFSKRHLGNNTPKPRVNSREAASAETH